MALPGVLAAGPAWAHATERAFVLTLPTGLYLAGGTIVVAASFALAALLTRPFVDRLARLERGLRPVAPWIGDRASVVSLLVVAALIVAGFTGTRDPLTNPLPAVIWSLWWIGLTAVQALVGDLWAGLNPWRGAHVLLRALPLVRALIVRPPRVYPTWLGCWPAAVGLLGFAWFELVYWAPRDPAVLVYVVAAYLGLHLAGTLAFGLDPWLSNAETFSVYFRMVSWPAPLGRGRDGGMAARPPGLGLLHVGPLPAGSTAFVLTALAAVSFDGLSDTFWWLGSIGVNPLEVPGRTALVAPNTLGLIGAVLVLGSAFAAAVGLGRRLARDATPLATRLRESVVAIVPIALGYHLAHYAPTFLVDVQYAALALSDPFALGWDLLRPGRFHVTTSFLTTVGPVRLIWHAQVGLIVLAHIAAVLVGHAIALRRVPGHSEAVLSQAPLTGLMIAYTLFGLWLLATPVAG